MVFRQDSEEPNLVWLDGGSHRLAVSRLTGKIERLQALFQGSETPKLVDLLVRRPVDSAELLAPHVTDRFGIQDAWGCDECFPSVGGNASQGIRDHGEIWGRPAEVRLCGETLESDWSLAAGAHFLRRISVSPFPGGCRFSFVVSFPVAFCSDENRAVFLSSLYASHALFAVDSDDIFEVFEISHSSMAEGLATAVKVDGAKRLWNGCFPHERQITAQKFYFSAQGGLLAGRLRCKNGCVLTVICGGGLEHLGIWWCNNGWGDGRSHRTIGIEPTNIPSDGPIFSREEGNVASVSFEWLLSFS